MVTLCKLLSKTVTDCMQCPHARQPSQLRPPNPACPEHIVQAGFVGHSPFLLQFCSSAGATLCGSSSGEPRCYLAQADTCALPICGVAKNHTGVVLAL